MGTFKEEPAGDPHHPHPPQQGSHPQQLQHPRPINLAHPQSHPNSPHQSHHPGAFPSPHSSTHSVPLQHRSPYPPPTGPNGHLPPEYYTPGPYDAPVTGPYSSTEGSEIMTAVRPYQQNVYHTPQSNSPVSVASSQSHEQHARMYAQPPAQMQQTMYGYPQYQVPPNAYPQQQQQPHQMMTSQPLLPHQQGPPPMSHQSPVQQQAMNSPRPQPKLEPGTISRPMDPATLQRSPPGPLNSNQSTPSAAAQNANGLHANQAGGPGVNPNAAPGPIPATTPLVVRQDNNGVQWIAFEYSRDRVKMEYTIRCDVESVNTDELSSDFRGENCVYPRACSGKDGYRGNRFQYEMECNTVGWALAELNPCLRGKRGLIQRAVDSWRNSNQDPRLRSRRVRRMAKMNNRKTVANSHTPNHMAGPRDVGAAPPSTTPMTAPGHQRPPPTNISLAGQAQLHHHHANPDGSQPGSTDDVSVNGDLTPQQQPKHTPKTNNAIRPNNIFYPTYPIPPSATGGASVPPQLHNGIDTMPNHTTVSASTGALGMSTRNEGSASPDPSHDPVFGDIPLAKRRKFVVINDVEKNNKGVRVKFDLQTVPIHEAPDSYRKINSVYPRAWYPTQMQLSPRSRGGKGRFLKTREEDFSDEMEVDGEEPRGTVMVKMPMLEGREDEFKVPALSRRAREREEKLNDLGYRMSWSQSRSFANRVLFLQRGLDKYRNKMKETLVAGGQEVSTMAPHFETRVGKRRFIERHGKGKGKRAASPSTR